LTFQSTVAVATVALGAEADFELLKEIAAETGGNYYRTENARDLPKIFDKETRLNTRTVRLRGQIGVSAGNPSPITGSLVGQKLAGLSKTCNRHDVVLHHRRPAHHAAGRPRLGRTADRFGRQPILLIGFAVLQSERCCTPHFGQRAADRRAAPRRHRRRDSVPSHR